jgi:hypothetical protein
LAVAPIVVVETESFAPFAKEFFAVAKLTRWVIYGTPGPA